MENNRMTEKLIQRVQKGDQDAFAQLYDLHFKPVYYYLLKMTGNAEDAADVAQDTFVTVYETIGNVSEPAAFVKWLHRIAHNKCVDMLRRHSKWDTNAELEDFSDILLEENEEFLPEHCLETRERRALVSQFVDDLPEPQKSAILLFYYQNFTTGQIADITDSNEGSVRKRLYDARQKLKLWLSQASGEDNYGVMAIPILTRIFLEEADISATAAIQQSILAEIGNKLGLSLQSPSGADASAASQTGAAGSAAASAGTAAASHSILGVVALAATAVATITGAVLVVRHINASGPIEVSGPASIVAQASSIFDESESISGSSSASVPTTVAESKQAEPYPTSAPESSQVSSSQEPVSNGSDDVMDYYRPGRVGIATGTSRQAPDPPKPVSSSAEASKPADGPSIFLPHCELIYGLGQLLSIEQMIADCGFAAYDPDENLLPFTMYERDGNNTIYTNISGTYHIIFEVTFNGITVTKELTLKIVENP